MKRRGLAAEFWGYGGIICSYTAPSERQYSTNSSVATACISGKRAYSDHSTRSGSWPLIHLPVQTDRSICFSRRCQPAIHSTSHQNIAIGDSGFGSFFITRGKVPLILKGGETTIEERPIPGMLGRHGAFTHQGKARVA